jgi:hypothetical protein
VARLPPCSSAIFCNACMCFIALASLTWLASCCTGGSGAVALDLVVCSAVGGGAVGGGSSTPVPQAVVASMTKIPINASLIRDPVSPNVEISMSTADSVGCLTT